MLAMSAVIIGAAVAAGWCFREQLTQMAGPPEQWIPGWLLHGQLPEWRPRLHAWHRLSYAEQLWLDEQMAWLDDIRHLDNGLRDATEQAAADRLKAKRKILEGR